MALSLLGCLTMAGTRLLSRHRDLIKGRPLLGTLAKPVPASLTALGTDPGACPSRSMSSLWGQPGHILAFERLGSWKGSRFAGCCPSQRSQPGLPPPAAPQGGAQRFERFPVSALLQGTGLRRVGPHAGTPAPSQCPGGCCLRPKAASLVHGSCSLPALVTGLCERGVQGGRTGAVPVAGAGRPRAAAVPRPALGLQLCHPTVRPRAYDCLLRASLFCVPRRPTAAV